MWGEPCPRKSTNPFQNGSHSLWKSVIPYLNILLLFYFFVRIDSECLILFLIEFQSCIFCETPRHNEQIETLKLYYKRCSPMQTFWVFGDAWMDRRQGNRGVQDIISFWYTLWYELDISLSRTSDKITSPCYQFTRFPAEVRQLWNSKCSRWLGTRFSQE